jgi:hypothetical protein
MPRIDATVNKKTEEISKIKDSKKIVYWQFDKN